MKVRTLGELADHLGLPFTGERGVRIRGVSGFTDSRTGDVTLAVKPKFLESIAHCKAAVVIVSEEAGPLSLPTIRAKNPYYAFARVLELFEEKRPVRAGIHPTAVIGKNVEIGAGCEIGPLVVLGDDVKIGAGTVVSPHVTIGDHTRVGSNTLINANVSIYHETSIGDRVIIHSGTVLGSDGYGFTQVDGRHYKVPQIGHVVVEDDVEIGANVTVDRATTGTTRIGAGTKIDNLVHIAHNVQIGENCLIIAQVGVSGSVVLGRGVTLAGQVGVVGHLSIGDGSIVAARSVVTGDLSPRSFVSGFPAIPHKNEMKIKAALKRLPGLVKSVAELQRQRGSQGSPRKS